MPAGCRGKQSWGMTLHLNTSCGHLLGCRGCCCLLAPPPPPPPLALAPVGFVGWGAAGRARWGLTLRRGDAPEPAVIAAW